MNVLADKFPTSIEIDGKEYELNTDFRVGLNIMLAFEDLELTGQEKNLVMLRSLYKEIPPDPLKACELAVFFLDCGEGADEGTAPAKRVYSFSRDAKYIYSAIRQTHGIDLEAVEHLHWWKFCYLLLDLDQDSFFQQIIYLRRQKQRGKLTKEERETCMRLHDILELPEQKDQEAGAAEREFMEKFESHTDNSPQRK